MFPMTSIRIVYRAYEKWSENGGTRLGAALAYYALFSVAPLLLIAGHISAAVFGQDAAKGKLHDRLQAVMGQEVALEVEKFVAASDQTQDTFWTPTVSALFLL